LRYDIETGININKPFFRCIDQKCFSKKLKGNKSNFGNSTDKYGWLHIVYLLSKINLFPTAFFNGGSDHIDTIEIVLKHWNEFW